MAIINIVPKRWPISYSQFMFLYRLTLKYRTDYDVDFDKRYKIWYFSLDCCYTSDCYEIESYLRQREYEFEYIHDSMKDLQNWSFSCNLPFCRKKIGEKNINKVIDLLSKYERIRVKLERFENRRRIHLARAQMEMQSASPSLRYL